MDIYKLRIFEMVAAQGSFNKAATHLSLSQPSVSQHIHDLERQIGTPLFDRAPTGVTLTPAGEMLLNYARGILRMVSEAESAMQRHISGDTHQLLMGSSLGASCYLLPTWIHQFHQRFPEARTLMISGRTSDIYEEMLAQKLEIGIVEGEYIESNLLGVLVLEQTIWSVVVNKQHPWADRETITVDDMQNQPYIHRTPNSQTREWLDQIFAEFHITPNTIAEFDSIEGIKQAVHLGMGYAILPHYILQTDETLHCLKVEGLVMTRALKLIWTRDEPFSPTANAFLMSLADRFPHVVRLIEKRNRFVVTDADS